MEEKFSKDKNPDFYVEIITPKDPAQRGCQLSIQVSVPIANIKKELDKRGVVVSSCVTFIPCNTNMCNYVAIPEAYVAITQETVPIL